MKSARGFVFVAAALAAVCASLSPTPAGAWSGGGHIWAAEAAAQMFGAGQDPYVLHRPCLLPGETRYRLWPTTGGVDVMVLDVQDICRDTRFGVPIMPELGLVVQWHNAAENCIDTECGSDYIEDRYLWDWFRQGAIEMDYFAGDLGTRNHFWSSEEGPHECPEGIVGLNNAWEVAEQMWIRAVDFWNGDPADPVNNPPNLGAAYTTLGYALHLVQDMGQPAHSNSDLHGPGNYDSLEEWMTEEHCRYAYFAWRNIPAFPPPLLEGIGVPPANVPHHWLNDFEIVSTLNNAGDLGSEVLEDPTFTNGDLIAHYEMPQVFYIMYMMNQIGGYFASDGEDGDTDEPFGWVNWYGFPSDNWLYDVEENELVSAQDCDGLAGSDDNDGCNCDEPDHDLSTHIFPWTYGPAFNASKFFLDLFRKTVDGVPPVTPYTLTADDGTALDVNTTWFHQPVTVTLTAATDQANSGFRPSGVWATWGLINGARFPDASPTPNPSATLTWRIDWEDSHNVQLLSTDMMGNVEQTNVPIRIDLTRPWLHLTDAMKARYVQVLGGTMTQHFHIAWEASDSLSGLATTGAELDGMTVPYNGASVNVDDLAVGAHSLTIHAMDLAGNVASLLYPFQVFGPTACGNGTVDSGEACDDGNSTEGDGCDSNCTFPACGNGIPSTSTGEECDGIAHCDPGCTCTTGYTPDLDSPGFCQPVVCGNGLVEDLEACDDGNSSDADGCSSTCVQESGYTCSGTPTSCVTTCGDGVAAGLETCDDGNLVDGDGCDSNCTVTACGNGIVVGEEECEDGNSVDGDGCDSNCTLTACGNGVLTGEELCDDGNMTSGDGCEWDCTPTGCGVDPDNDTRWFATPFGDCGLLSAAVDCSGDVDFYSFTAPSAGSYTFATTPAGSASVGLYDSSGNSLDQGLTSVTRSLVANQQLFVRVSAATAGSTLYYGLEVTGCGAAPSPEYDYYVSATAKLAGAAGTNWVSDLAVLNPGSSTATIDVDLWLRDQANPDPQSQTLTLQPGELQKELDVLSSVFGLASGAASIHLRSDQPLVVASRTYNDTGAGTYGQFIAGVADSELLPADEIAYLGGLVENADYRTNLGLLNPTASEIRITVSFWSNDGAALGNPAIFHVPAFGSIQSNRVLASVTSSEVEDAWAYLTCNQGEFIAFASMVDNHTGDPVYRPALVAPNDAVDVILSGAAKLAGAAGTNWVTDTAALNTRATAQNATVRLWLRDADNTAPAETSLAIEAGQLAAVRDVMVSLFGSTSGAGALQVVGGPGLVVGARTYNLVATGTYGQNIPAVDAADAISGSAKGYLVMTTQCADYRTNLGLVNIDDQPADVEVRLLDAAGAQVGATKTYSLGAQGVKQVNVVVQEFTSGSLTAGYLELSIAPATPDGKVHAYASVVDASTGDPIFERVSVVGSSAR